MERRHEVTRLEGFSDAVFGFALTLLVVSLEVPRNSVQLIDTMRGFLPFALMFAMICWIWYQHHEFFRHYELAPGPWVVALNSLLLFVVLFYVYPLKYMTVRLVGPLVGMHDPETGLPLVRGLEQGDIVMLLYGTGVVLIFSVFVALYRHAWSQRLALGLDAEGLVRLRSGMRGHMISAGLGVVSILIVLYASKQHKEDYWFMAGGMVYALMGPLHGWNGYLTGRNIARLKKAPVNAKR